MVEELRVGLAEANAEPAEVGIRERRLPNIPPPPPPEAVPASLAAPLVACVGVEAEEEKMLLEVLAADEEEAVVLGVISVSYSGLSRVPIKVR